MGLDGGGTPGRLSFAPPAAQFTVVSGTPANAEVSALRQTNRFISTYKNGLRDLRNSNLAPYFAETPRSRVSSVDAQERYGAIGATATELGISPISAELFTSFFLPVSAQQRFVDILGKFGIQLTLIDDFIDTDVELIAYRNAQTSQLVGEQQATGQVLSPGFINEILAEMEMPLAIDSTKHFANNFATDDALDVDRKARERIAAFVQYIRDLLDL